MLFNKILKIGLIATCILFIVFQVLGMDIYAAAARAISVLFFVAIYTVSVKNKRMYFYLFLISFGIGEIINYSSYFSTIDYSTQPDYFYFAANFFYIFSYILLILNMLQGVNLKEVALKFWPHILVLIVLDIFCVLMVTDTAKNALSYHSYYLLELTYNGIIMALLTVAMVNYMYKNTEKSMNLLLGTIFIFFSEVIQTAYFYISDIKMLNVLCSLFLVFAFLFFYLQSQIISDDNPSIGQNATTV